LAYANTTIPEWLREALHKINATHTSPPPPPPPPPPPEATATATKAAGGLAEALKHPSPAAIAVSIFFALAILAIILYAVWRSMGARYSKSVFGRVIDPQRYTEQLVELFEISPGLYASADAKILAFIPANAVALTDVKTGRKVYPLVKTGGVYVYANPESMLEISLGLHEIPYRPSSMADLIMYLYEKGEIPARLKLRPDMDVAIHIDARKLAENLAEMYDKMAEESVVSIAGLTGKRREFEEYVRASVEAVSKKASAIAGAVLKIGVILLIIGIIAVAIASKIH